MRLQTENPVACDDRAPNTFCVAVERSEDNWPPAIRQTEVSREAISAARDATFDALVETASLIESYGRSLGEAAWRGDRLTVEAHLRQLRLGVIAAIDVFKLFDQAEQKGGGA